MTKVYITESGYKLNVASTLRMTASEAETLLDGVFEPVLGNPGTNGYVLSSTTAGVRSWVASASDVADLTTTTGSSTNMLRVAAAGGLEYRTTAQVLSDIGAAPTASPTFTGTVTLPTTVASVIKPASDSTTALQLANAAGTAVVTVDTTNNFATLGIAGSRARLTFANGAYINEDSTGVLEIRPNNTVVNFIHKDGAAQNTYWKYYAGSTGRLQLIDNNSAIKLTLYSNGRMSVGQDVSPTAIIDLAASTTAVASLRIRSGTAPTTPNAGDVWNDGTDFNLYGSGLKLHSGVIKPASDSTTALQLTNAAGTAVLTVDTTNGHIGIGATPNASYELFVQGNTWCSTAAASKFVALSGGSAASPVYYKSTSGLYFPDGGPAVAIAVSGLENATFGDGAALSVAASTTAAASLRIRSGTAPTTPNAGDIWFNGTNLMMYDGTTTRTISWT